MVFLFPFVPRRRTGQPRRGRGTRACSFASFSDTRQKMKKLFQKSAPDRSNRSRGSIKDGEFRINLSHIFIATEIAHKLSPLVDGRIARFLLAHAAAKIVQRIETVRLHPAFEVIEHGFDMRRPLLVET